jgi:hypothetical protein
VTRLNHGTVLAATGLAAPAPGNEQFPWDRFDSKWYLNHNYGTLRDDDRQILRLLGEFFSKVGRGRLSHGVDVGTGANLYPLLAMLPLCDRVTPARTSEEQLRLVAP